MGAETLAFRATIGVDVTGETWSCIAIPDSANIFGTRKSVRVDARVDDVQLDNVGAMVTGTGGHMISLSAKIRARLGKDIGDDVDVQIAQRWRWALPGSNRRHPRCKRGALPAELKALGTRL